MQTRTILYAHWITRSHLMRVRRAHTARPFASASPRAYWWWQGFRRWACAEDRDTPYGLQSVSQATHRRSKLTCTCQTLTPVFHVAHSHTRHGEIGTWATTAPYLQPCKCYTSTCWLWNFTTRGCILRMMAWNLKTYLYLLRTWSLQLFITRWRPFPS